MMEAVLRPCKNRGSEECVGMLAAHMWDPPWGNANDAANQEQLGVLALLAGALLMLVNIALSLWLSLGLHKTMLVAALRYAIASSGVILM